MATFKLTNTVTDRCQWEMNAVGQSSGVDDDLSVLNARIVQPADIGSEKTSPVFLPADFMKQIGDSLAGEVSCRIQEAAERALIPVFCMSVASILKNVIQNHRKCESL